MTTALQGTQIPQTAMMIGVPEGWTIFREGSRLLAVEADATSFATSVNVTVDPEADALPADVLTPLTDALIAPAFVNLNMNDDAVDVLVCHLAGGISATALQRYVVTPKGLLVATVTAATSRWEDVADLAESIVNSLRAAA